MGTALFFVSGAGFAKSQADYGLALSHWQQVLEKYVDEQGQIDFISLAKQPEHIEAYINFASEVDPESHPQLFLTSDDVLAYHINTYNSLAMYGIIKGHLPSDFDGFFKRLWFFKLRDVVVGGKKTSLYDYENDVIRSLGEPRVHFVLNCMVKDCPRLPRKVFMAETLEQDLAKLSWEFLNKPKHLYINHQQQLVYVSEILDFYIEDFVTSGKAQDLISYINQFRHRAIPDDYQLQFIDYDWRVNQQP